MLNLTPTIRIYLCTQPTDMRRGFDRLAEEARVAVNEDPLSGHLFVFRNKRENRLKVLYWDRNGFAIWYKRLERGRFVFPANQRDGAMTISPTAFQLLIGGAIRKGS
jgi:transposase